MTKESMKEQILGCSTLILTRQYRSILIPNSDAQTELAIAGLSSAPPASKTVVLEGGGMFTVAEQRHQKNRLRRDPAMVRCLVQSGQDDLTSSYLATRLNGWGSYPQGWIKSRLSVLFLDKYSPLWSINPLPCAGFSVEKARWDNSTRSGRVLAWVRIKRLTWEEPLLNEVNLSLSVLMTQSQTLTTDFAEVWNRSDSEIHRCVSLKQVISFRNMVLHGLKRHIS